VGANVILIADKFVLRAIHERRTQMVNYRGFVVMGVVVIGLVTSSASVRVQEDPAQQSDSTSGN
jgi:hypothetical protein